jgi:predicted helicase
MQRMPLKIKKFLLTEFLFMTWKMDQLIGINLMNASLFAPQKIKNDIRPHQKKAITEVIKGFETKDRGKLIMACGTGKTFTSLKIAEKIGGSILFLTPSIALVSQTFNEWAIQSSIKINPIIICSDKTIKADDDDISTYDLTIAPTTDPKLVSETCKKIFKNNELNVIFSTYQSIDVVIKAQEYGLKDFDLIICDEAHRTTGVTLSDRDDTHFTKVHDNDHIKSKRRLYMTATPKIYKESDKQSANKFEADIYSMDDEKSYGTEFHRLGFGEAVEKNLLSDYKVMVLGVEEQYANKFLQQDGELQVDDDIIKIIGCWNGLAKRLVGTKKIELDQANALTGDPLEGNPMRRAVAFCQRIKDSQRFQKLFSETVNKFLNYTGQKEDFLKCEVDHMDGSMSSLIRKEKLKWLKEDTSSKGNICRIISNAKCMSEGVDVPTLDAVIFLNPKNSYVDVVQSVGRAMRKAEGKKYGYIIIPISIPANIPPEQALNDNKKYKVVWDVCQALRSHDDRFNNYINKIKFNNNSTEILYSQIGDGADFKDESSKGSSSDDTSSIKQLTLDLPSAQVWQNAILGKIAKKCGDTEYWDEWAKSVSTIAEKHTINIKKLLKSRNFETKDAFEKFIKGLRKNINPSVSEEDAIEMLSQHLITKPVFEALFESYEFVKKNPVSKAIQKILKVLDDDEFNKDQITLDKFYVSIRNKIKGIDNAAGKQAVIKELYDKFFNIAFPKMANRLGIVYTPIEIVDFMIQSVEDVLKSEFDTSFNNKGVNILDPFTGTGTFIVRLLQSEIIKDKNLLYKYLNEMHANEIVLLAYYIAAINIEECFHYRNTIKDYQTFDGISAY